MNMKKHLALACMALVLFTAGTAQAQTTYYYDNVTGAGFGEAGGTWAAPTPGPNPGWTIDGTGAAVPGSVTTGTGDTLNFGNGALGLGAGTITVSGTQNAGDLTFASGSGAITLQTGTITLGATSTITVNNAADTISSVLSGAATSLTKIGAGTLTLSGANTYSGATTVNAGTLKLDFSAATAPTTDIISSSSALVLGGGTLNLTGKASTTNSQAVNGTTINVGTSAITLTANATANPLSLSLGAITRNVGSTLRITLPTGTPSATNGVLTTSGTGGAILLDNGVAYATIGTWDWAGKDSSNTWIAPPTYTAATATSLSGNASLNTMFGTTTLSSDTTITSLRAKMSRGYTVNINAGITLTTGGIFVGSGVDDGGVFYINGPGSLRGPAGQDLVFLNHPLGITRYHPTKISAPIVDNGSATGFTYSGLVPASGMGELLFLTGTNSYTGTTRILGGTLSIGDGGTTGELHPNSQIVNSGSLIINRSNDLTFSNSISGTGTLTKSGAGAVLLPNNNTYTGVTAINGGILQANVLDGAGTGALGNGGMITFGGGTLQFGSALNNQTVAWGARIQNSAAAITLDSNGQAVTISNAIPSSNTGGLTKAGSGTLTLSGANAYTGTTTVNAGTLTLTGNNTYNGTTSVTAGKLVGVVGGSCSNSAVTVSGGTLGVSVTDSTKQWTCKSLSHTAASTLEFAFGATVPGTSVAPLKVEGNVALNAAPTVSCTGAGLTGLATGAYPLIKWTGTASGFLPSAVTLSSGSGVLLWDATNKTLWLILGNTRPAITWQGPAASEWKANESGYTYWKDAALADTYYQENMVGGLLGDSVVFGATGVGTVTLNTIVTPLAVSVNTASPNNYTISGSGGIAGGSLTKSGTSTLILATDNTYAGGTTISAGTLQVGDGGASGSLGSGSVLNNDTLIFNVTDSVTNGPISGTGSLTQNGSGILTLGGASTYTGTTTVNSGALLLNTLVVNAFTSETTINSGGTLTLGAANLLVDTAAITVNGGGIFNLNGSAETIARVAGTGGTVTNSGALATLTMTGAGTRTISNVFRGNLNLSIQGSSVITLTGSSTYTGSTTIGVNGTGGTKVLLGVNNALPVGTAASIGGTGDTIGFDLLGYSQALGPMTLNCNQNWATMEVTDSVGGGVLTLTGGASAVTSGTGNGSQGKISVATLDLNNATQAFDVRNTFTVTSLIQNGALTKTTGTGTLILSGNNTYAGSTLISAGTLQLNNKLALQNSPLDTAGAGTVNLNAGAGAYTLGGLSGSKNLALVITGNPTSLTNLVLNTGAGVTNTYSGIIDNRASAMNLTKTGAGTQILSGVNTYSGKTVVSNGVLDVRDTATLSNSSGLQIDYDIATLRLENADNGGSPWTHAALLALEPNATAGATGPATDLRFTVNGVYTDITAKKTVGTLITFR